MYDAVCLASGGLDSLVCLHLLKGNGVEPLPLFIDYGQRNRDRELASLKSGVIAAGLHAPVILDVAGFGKIVKSGLTDSSLRVLEDAFTPNRNLFFIVLAAAVAYSRGVRNIVLGFLAERTAIFPDQTDAFLASAEVAISQSLGVQMRITCPLRDLVKSQVVVLSETFGVSGYSCHAGGEQPCGRCIACLEYNSGD